MAPEEPPVPIGSRLRVWWEEEEAWFTGTVKEYVVDDDTHLVVYDDGDEQHELFLIGRSNTSCGFLWVAVRRAFLLA